MSPELSLSPKLKSSNPVAQDATRDRRNSPPIVEAIELQEAYPGCDDDQIEKESGIHIATDNKQQTKDLYRIGLTTMAAITIHNFPEEI